MSAHTPGPWAVIHDAGVFTIVPAMRDDVIADLINNPADARLIHAAPALLAALKLALGPLFAYRDASGEMADRVNKIILPAVRAAMALTSERTP